jgi:hypothetical protein
MDDADEELSQLAIRQALETEGLYSEFVPSSDMWRVTQFYRLAPAVARELSMPLHIGTHSAVGGILIVVKPDDQFPTNRRR